MSAEAVVGIATRPARVLIVDDERYIREFCRDCLALHGHAVVGVADGGAALEAYERERPDLVITDLSMPGMSGWELAAELERRDPTLPVILLTGWSAREEAAHARELGIARVLAKPVTLEELRTSVADVLAHASRPAASR
jgi:two-component system capsular synthesis sensor histidine kinase RcsC